MNGFPEWGWTTSCSCGKKIYKSRKNARRAAKVFHPEDQTFSTYECNHPKAPVGAWHIGHLPRSVGEGSTSRSDIRNFRTGVVSPCSHLGSAHGSTGWQCNLESGHAGPHLAQNALGEWINLR